MVSIALLQFPNIMLSILNYFVYFLQDEQYCYSSLPVACCRRYLSQVFPDPGKDARATTGPGAAFIPSGLHQLIGTLPTLLSLSLTTIILLSNILPDKLVRSADWILLSARVLASILVTEMREAIMMYRVINTQARNNLTLQSPSITPCEYNKQTSFLTSGQTTVLDNWILLNTTTSHLLFLPLRSFKAVSGERQKE